METALETRSDPWSAAAVDEHRGWLTAYVLAMTGDPGAADDLVREVTVRLALKGLEGFSAECGGRKVSGFINSSGVKGGELAAERKGDFIEVALPEGFAAGAGEKAALRISWVDFYR